MYKKLDIATPLEASADAYVIQERMQYAKFIEAGENFCISRGLVLGGTISELMHLSSGAISPTRDTFTYDIYTDNVVLHSRELVQLMYDLDPDGLGKFASMTTDVPKYTLSVFVNRRKLFKLTQIYKHRGAAIDATLLPNSQPTQFARVDGVPAMIKCAGPEILLLDSYSILCNPSNAGIWSKTRARAQELMLIFETDIHRKIKMVITGGGVYFPNEIYYILRDQFAAASCRVLVGSVATHLLTGRATFERLQVITANPLEKELKTIEDLLSRLRVKTTHVIFDPKLPGDLHLRKMTVFIVNGASRTPIIDIYNAGTFSLIPYVLYKNIAESSKVSGKQPPGTLKVGTPYVLIYYKLIAMWTIFSLLHLKAVEKSTASKLITTSVLEIKLINKYMSDLIKSDIPMHKVTARLVPLHALIGHHEDKAILNKRIAADNKIKYHPYLPVSKSV
jgi:hypothetical protein